MHKQAQTELSILHRQHHELDRARADRQRRAEATMQRTIVMTLKLRANGERRPRLLIETSQKSPMACLI
jgi:hypothetical protein